MSKRLKNRSKFIDDGRVVAPMNVEGMPWYTPGKETRAIRGGDDAGAGDGAGFTVKLTRRENIAFTFGVLKAVLLVTVVFIGSLFLFILFCTNIWFR